MSGFVNIALFFPRYLMVAGLTVLALAFFSSQLNAMGSGVDFELILPYAIRNFIPVGLMGILLAGLLSAFMSTFAATVNAAPAYIVNDIYKRFINPGASPKRLVRMSYAASIAVVIIGIAFGFVIDSINDITLWITSSLWGGYAASNILKWYWWRFNGFGYFWGMVAGILGALVVPVLFPDISSMNSFPIILAIATVGCVGGSLLTKPDTDEILLSFYTTVRPWGIWGPVREKALAADPNFKVNRNFLKDMTNVVIGLIWQAALIATPIYIVIRQKAAMGIGLGVILVCTFLLKKNWYDRLES